MKRDVWEWYFSLPIFVGVLLAGACFISLSFLLTATNGIVALVFLTLLWVASIISLYTDS